MNKKGLFYTMGFLILSLVFLSFSVVIFHNTLEGRERLSEIGKLDRVNELTFSIGESLNNLVNLHSGINTASSSDVNTTVTFKETLPNPKADFFKEKLNIYASYIKNEYQSSPNISINNITILDELPLIVKPYNIVFKHGKYGKSDLEITPEEINVLRYDIIIETLHTNANIDDGNLTAGGANLTLNLTVKNNLNVLASLNRLVDPTKDSYLIISFSEGGESKGDSYIYFYNPARIVVDKKNVDQINVTAKVYLNGSFSPLVYLPENSINLEFRELGILKSSSVRIN